MDSNSGVDKPYDEIWKDFRADPRFAMIDYSELLRIHRKWMNLGKKLNSKGV